MTAATGVRGENPTDSAERESVNVKYKTKLVIICLFGFVLLGSLVFPDWWHTLLFERGLFSQRHLVNSGLIPLRDYGVGVVLAALVAIVILVIFHPDRLGLYRKLKSTWSAIRYHTSQSIGAYAIAFLTFSLALSLITLPLRAPSDDDLPIRLRGNYIRTAETLDLLTVLKDKRQEAQPLADPTAFIYLSKENVESLYGQFEPELVPASVIEEMKNSTELKGELNLQNFLKTEAGKNALQSKITEYRQAPKSAERKLKDLVHYQFENKNIKRYGNLRVQSEEIKELDQATQMLATKYNLVVDQNQLRPLRDRLLGQEMQRLVTELHDIRGLVMIEGDWAVEIQPDAYLFTRPFVENVTEPPMCETKIKKNELSSQYRDIIEGLKGSRMRLSVFGNVITGLSNGSRTVRLNPIAVF